MNYTTILIYGLILLLISVVTIIMLIRDRNREEYQFRKCKDCYYRDDQDDFSPCRMCDNGSRFKDYGEGQTEDYIRDWRL